MNLNKKKEDKQFYVYKIIESAQPMFQNYYQSEDKNMSTNSDISLLCIRTDP